MKNKQAIFRKHTYALFTAINSKSEKRALDTERLSEHVSNLKPHLDLLVSFCYQCEPSFLGEWQEKPLLPTLLLSRGKKKYKYSRN